MFKGKFDADPSELSAATAVTGHVNDQVAGLQQILAREKIAPFRTQQCAALSDRERQNRLPTDRIRQPLLLLSVRSRRVPNQRRRWSRHITVRKRLQKGHNVTLVLGRKPKIPDQSGYIFRHFRRRPAIHFLAR